VVEKQGMAPDISLLTTHTAGEATRFAYDNSLVPSPLQHDLFTYFVAFLLSVFVWKEASLDNHMPGVIRFTFYRKSKCEEL